MTGVNVDNVLEKPFILFFLARKLVLTEQVGMFNY